MGRIMVRRRGWEGGWEVWGGFLIESGDIDKCMWQRNVADF